MARFKNDNVFLEPFQKLSFRDDDGSEAASIYWDGDQMVFDGITISGAQGPAGPAGTGVPGNYIGDEDGNTRVTINTSDYITMRTAGTDILNVTPGGDILVGDEDPTTVDAKLNIVHTGNNTLSLDRHTTSDGAPGIWFKKSRGTRDAVGIAGVAADDNVGMTRFFAYGINDGITPAAFVEGARMTVAVAGDPDVNHMPMDFEFYTTADTFSNATKSFTITAGGGIKLQDGVEVNEIRETLDSGHTDALVTSQGIYNAVSSATDYVDEVFATLSGIDMRMNRLFDNTFSGTEMVIENDEIVFYNEGTAVAKVNNSGQWELGGVGIRSILSGSIATEHSADSVPTSSAVKAYVDSFGAPGGFSGTKLQTDSLLSKFEITDNAWVGSMAGEPILQAFQYSHGQGLFAGEKTHHIWFGDQTDNTPDYDITYGDAGYGTATKPAFAFHATQGSRLFIFNYKGYGDDTFPGPLNTPGIIIDRYDTSVNDETGLLKVGGLVLRTYHGNDETYPDLPDTEHQAELHLGSYGVYNGEPIAQNQSVGGDYPGGLLKLYCKLRFGNGYQWGYENDENYTHPYTTEDTENWGHFGNNVWVNRIAGCHYTKTAAEVGDKWYKDASAFVGTGNDDHCLVTGKYVHEAIDLKFTELEDKTVTNYIYADPTDVYDGVEGRATVGTGGSAFTVRYGYSDSTKRQFILNRGVKANHNSNDKYQSAAIFRDIGEGVHNVVQIECVSPGASNTLYDQQQGYTQTAPKLRFFRSRAKYYGVANTYGNDSVQYNDILGEISWQAQAPSVGYERNPCTHVSAYKNSAAIRVFAGRVGDYAANANMKFYVRGATASYEDMYESLQITETERIVMGNTTHNCTGNYWFTEGRAGSLATPGRVHVFDRCISKDNLSGNVTINSVGTTTPNASLMFAGQFTIGDTMAFDMAKYVGSKLRVTSGNYGPVGWARVDGGTDDPGDATNNSGRLSLLIHKQNSFVFNEAVRIDGSGKMLLGDDDAGLTCDVVNPKGKLVILQPTDTYNGGIALYNEDQYGSFIFTGTDNDLIVEAGSDGSRQLSLNPGDGVVHIGGVGDTGANYILRTNGSIIPAVNNTYDLGSSTYKWDDIWSTNPIIQTSDRRQKTDIANADLGLKFVLGMKPRKFKRVGGNRTHWGFIAQEIEELVGKFGRKTKDAAFLVKDDQGNYGLRDTEFIPIIVKALQELAAKVGV